jgi:recombination protein RecA
MSYILLQNWVNWISYDLVGFIGCLRLLVSAKIAYRRIKGEFMMATALREQVRSALIHRFDVDFTLHQKSAPEMAETGIQAIDALTGGIPRTGMTEIYGPASSGRMSLLVSILAQATHRHEFCALIDTSGSFDPTGAEAAGVYLPHLLWVRCGGNAGHALKAADLLVQAGGFGVVAMDLAGLEVRDAQRISLASWFRLRHTAEKARAAFVVIGSEVNAKSCSTLQLALRPRQAHWSGQLFDGLTAEALSAKTARGTDVRLSVRPR